MALGGANGAVDPFKGGKISLGSIPIEGVSDDTGSEKNEGQAGRSVSRSAIGYAPKVRPWGIAVMLSALSVGTGDVWGLPGENNELARGSHTVIAPSSTVCNELGGTGAVLTVVVGANAWRERGRVFPCFEVVVQHTPSASHRLHES